MLFQQDGELVNNSDLGVQPYRPASGHVVKIESA
jgi:hypothetical protein